MLWKVLMQMKKDQIDFYKFLKDKFEWEMKLNQWSYDDNEVLPIFPNHILGELE